MIVRVVTYGAESLDAAEDWHRERAAEFEEIVGLERVDFIRQDGRSRAGAIMYFESADDLYHYKESPRFEWLRESIRESWAADAVPVQDDVFRVMEPEDAATEV